MVLEELRILISFSSHHHLLLKLGQVPSFLLLEGLGMDKLAVGYRLELYLKLCSMHDQMLSYMLYILLGCI